MSYVFLCLSCVYAQFWTVSNAHIYYLLYKKKCEYLHEESKHNYYVQ